MLAIIVNIIGISIIYLIIRRCRYRTVSLPQAIFVIAKVCKLTGPHFAVGRESETHPAFGFQAAVCRKENDPFGRDAFGEHAIRSEGDYERHVDYLHYNLVKHGHVTRVADWPYSSFHRYVRSGIYNLEWAADDNVRRIEMERCKRRDALRFPALRALPFLCLLSLG